MNKKLLILLQGIGGNGKSTVLVKMLELLLDDKQMIQFETKSDIPAQCVPGLDKASYPYDFIKISQLNGSPCPDILPTILSFKKNIIIGVASAGDYKGTVQKNLKIFDNENCNIMFCATKSYGGTIDYIHTYIESNPNAVLLPFYKSENKENDQKKYDENNLKLAKEILSVAKLRWNVINQKYNDFKFN